MSRVIFLKVESDQATKEAVISLQLCREGQLPPEINGGRLPPNPEIADLYQSWEISFRKLRQARGPGDGWIIHNSGVNQASSSDGEEACRELVRLAEANVKNWLLSGGNPQWQKIRERLAIELANTTDELSIVVKIKPPYLEICKLPWLAWDLLDAHREVGISFSFPEFENTKPSATPTLPGEVRILAVLGNNKNINLEPDEQAIRALEGATPHFLYQPSAKELIEALTDEKGWDIFFFAGHSESELETGRIYINDQESLAVEDFKNALKEAVSRGLKLGIFNSCDGLGLARKLGELGMQAIVVMKEAVPDEIAQAFLKEFLGQYSGGKSLCTAVRIAQQRLEKFLGFPGATWLPIVCQNPTAVPPRWEELGGENVVVITEKKKDPPPPPKDPATEEIQVQIMENSVAGRLVTMTSIVVAICIISLRFWGFFQPYELQAFDHLMQQRPYELRDDRLLIVTGEPEEPAPPNRASLSDKTLAQLVEKLQAYEPITIGFDIYRDFPVSPQYPQLATYLQQDNLFAICKTKGPKAGDPTGIAPPPEVSPDNLVFSDALPDGDGILRRHLLSKNNQNFNKDECGATNHIGFIVALHYLDSLNIKYQQIYDIQKKEKYLKIGDIVFEALKLHTGGYQGINAGGQQILLNYRALHSPLDIADTVTVADIIGDKISPAKIEELKHRIILIGINGSRNTSNDFWLTPYSATQPQAEKEIPGVFLVAHMVSQITSAVLDNRPLLWVWPLWGEMLWIWVWSLLGAILGFWRGHTPKVLGISIAGAIGSLYGICYLFILQAGWLPLIPPAIALVISAMVIILADHSKTSPKI
ncbi:MAG TPA: CHASE2 domain-containing protein [Oscillatoriaceae cyanobacterium M33_DOE_052]|uniref:CHASE2 domain-containing protein n=1 Tax=Planktothricoides sp. SpSt-374 TaxID=2282167 RepID=A0A7C3VLK5_9CYAN|nr:CHASE2 domain-containing protein [Oscillatoriaceae cyanobacterium M33_DOE_052]